MKLLLDLNTVDGYRTFLKVKSLPIHSFAGREAWFPDEYASRLGLSAESAIGMPYKPNPKLFDYQAAIAKIAIAKRKYAVFMEPGRGKTLIDFEYAHHAVSTTGGRVLIVCPPMVIQQMIDEHAKFYPSMAGPDRVRAAGLQEWLNGNGPAFGITNYEAIREGLTAGNLSALILSESSMLKSHYGKWGTRLIELGRGLNWKLCETGTPAPNDRIEYANHAVFLDQFPTAVWLGEQVGDCEAGKITVPDPGSREGSMIEAAPAGVFQGAGGGDGGGGGSDPRWFGGRP